MVRLPHYVTESDVPLPSGWSSRRIDELYDQLAIGVRRDLRSSSKAGAVPIIDQSPSGFLGFHSEEPGVQATHAAPVITFANHTCVMRIHRRPFSVIQNVFPKTGREGVCDTLYLYYCTDGRVSPTGYKGHHPEWRAAYVPLPPLDVQRRIVAILSPIDELIENTRRRVATVQSLAHAIYREWCFNRRLPNTARGGTRSPIRWVETTLGSVCSQIRERYDGDHPEKPLVDLSRIATRSLGVEDVGDPDELTSSRICFQEGDVLFGSIRPYLHKVALAPFDGVTNTSVLVLRPSERLTRELLPLLLSNDESVNWANQHATGTKMPVIKWDVLKDMPVIVPDESGLARLSNSVHDHLAFIRLSYYLLRNLRAMREFLIPRLVSGQVDVSQLDINTSDLVA